MNRTLLSLGVAAMLALPATAMAAPVPHVAAAAHGGHRGSAGPRCPYSSTTTRTAGRRQLRRHLTRTTRRAGRPSGVSTHTTTPQTAPTNTAPATQGSNAAPSGRTLNMVATAYGPSLKDNYPYGPVDYYGRPLKPGDVAVDPRVIPLGTRLYVTGYNSPYLPKGGFYAVADDTGGAIKGNRIDLFINGSPSEVSAFGVQHVKVTVLGG